jgi:lipopolysaccharide transport system permease protein
MAARTELPVSYLKPSHGWAALDLRDLWKYHELIYFLTWRDIKVRYKQTALGVAWAVIQPLLTVVIFSVIFGTLAKMPTDNNVAYPLFSYAAVLPWQLFQGALQRASLSLVGNAHLITKVYFPRLVIPVSAVLASLVDFGIHFVVLLGLMLYYGVKPTWNILWLFPLLLFALLTALAVGLWLSALNVQYRDVQHMVPFLLQAWMYASPVAYSASLVPSGKWQLIYSLNPLAGVIQGFRWALLGTQPPGLSLVVSVGVVLVLLVTGLIYFKRMERTFADIV